MGYSWPTMHKDARSLIRACQDCQVHKPVPRNLQQKLTLIRSPWPFYKWGIDIAGPFLEGLEKVKFLIVTIHYFTKWIEEKPVATITGNKSKNSCGRTLSVGSDSQERSYRIMENSSRTIHSKNGAENYAYPNTLLLLNIRKPMACFKPGDLVYRNNDASHAKDTGKLGPKWEGPYKVTKALGKGAYKLRDHDGKQLLRT
ncbi:reverse transcriptase domain-containing protein [Tanacetum coccineum]